jgi:hypothetical protein
MHQTNVSLCGLYHKFGCNTVSFAQMISWAYRIQHRNVVRKEKRGWFCWWDGHRHFCNLVLGFDVCLCYFWVLSFSHYEPGWSSPYNAWLRAGWPRGRSSSSGRRTIFLLSTSSRPVSGPTQPPIQWVLGALSPWVKRPRREADHSPPTTAEREADHSPPTTAEIKNTWIYTSTPSNVFMA